MPPRTRRASHVPPPCVRMSAMVTVALTPPGRRQARRICFDKAVEAGNACHFFFKVTPEGEVSYHMAACGETRDFAAFADVPAFVHVAT